MLGALVESGFVFLKNNLLISIFGCVGSSFYTQTFSRCSEWRLLSNCYAQASHHGGFSFAKHKLQSIGSVVVAHRLSCSVVYASSQTRGWTCIPCNGRWIFIHHTPREVQLRVFLRVSTQKNEGFFSEWKWNGGCVCQNCRNLLSSSGDLLRVLSRLPVLCLHYISRGARPLNKGSQWWSATK